jgi:hypothetical protein
MSVEALMMKRLCAFIAKFDCQRRDQGAGGKGEQAGERTL